MSDSMFHQIEFSYKLTLDDLDDLARLVRSRWYVLLFLAANWHGMLLIGALAFATIAAAWNRTPSANWMAILAIWTVVAGIWLWSVFQTRRERVKELAQVNLERADTVRLGPADILLKSHDGQTIVMPWSQFIGWEDGGRVLGLHRSGGRGSLILPIGSLPDVDRQRLRGILASHITADRDRERVG